MKEGPHPVFGGNGISGHHDEYMFDQPRIVIGRVGVYCGAIHRTPPRSWVTDNALFVAEHDSSLLGDYLEWALRLANLNQYASQSAQPLLSGSRIYPVELQVPSHGEQTRFAAALRTHSRVVDKARAAAGAADDLFRSLVQRAFRGDL